MAVYKAQFRHAQRKFPVTAYRAVVNKYSSGAVHRFNRKRGFIYLCEIHVLLVVIPVARTQPERPVEDHRGLDLDISAFGMFLPPERNEVVHNDHSLWVEEGESGAFRVYAEEVELFSQFPVIPRLGFFDPAEILLKLLLRPECRSVYAGQHFVLLITVPVRTGKGEEFEELAASGMRNVGAAAEVNEVTLTVGRKDLTLEGVDHFDFQVFSKFRKKLLSLLFCVFFPDQGDLFLGDLSHFRFDFGKILV